jgi:hypothetical protein
MEKKGMPCNGNGFLFEQTGAVLRYSELGMFVADWFQRPDIGGVAEWGRFEKSLTVYKDFLFSENKGIRREGVK